MCQTLTSQAAVAFIFIVACARISRGSRNEDLKYFGDGRRQLWFLNSFTLTPTLSRQREREQEDAPREAAAPTKPRPSAAMARVDFPSPLAVPRSAGRGAGAAAQHAALRALTCCGCLSGVSAANKASSAAPPHARASQVARSEAEGHGQWGRLFLWLLSFWRDKKKVTAPPGAHPGQQRHQHPSKPRQSPNGSRRKPFSAWNCSPPSSSSPPSPSP